MPYVESRIPRLFYRRVTYYWIALASHVSEIAIELLTIVVTISRNSGKRPDIARFVVAMLYSLIMLGLTGILLFWQYRITSSTGPTRINAFSHYKLTLLSFVMCPVSILFILVIDTSTGFFQPGDIRRTLLVLIIILLVISAAATAVRARGTGRVAESAVPTVVPAWRLATASESQRL
ncbi:hypothetical protein GALMADRAFT_1241707 [Galerina marginata CBS 339.88]|uniref:Uncharacterized protein n=1 Tax=Galerina marginata (strain CBS 339.88) TaxID=685588 RepID=A0A067T8N7_GALM3|nr:hypothetical protein GALMADRAFT_1241707 [Galerina marginata CBS 339.88]